MRAFKIFIISSLLLPVFLYSCKCNREKKGETIASDELKIPTDTKIANMEDLTYYRFPSPEEVFDLIDKSKLDYNNGLLNLPRNYKLYMNIQDQTLNMGVYIADLAYITLFEQHEESMEYFDAINQLATAIRISDAFHESLYKRISRNLDNVDSLIVISSEAYKDIVDYLTQTEQENLLALVSIGAYVESLYLILSYVDKYDPENEILKQVVDQKFAIDNLYDYANQYNNDLLVKSVLPKLDELKKVFNTIEEKPISKTKAKKDKNKLVISGGTELFITENQFEKLKKIINETRSEIVNKR
jgi:hypothetical protein